MYFKARKSTIIKTGKPQPSSKTLINIEDSPSAKVKESPSKTPITYERRTTTSSTWKGKTILEDPKQDLQEAKIVLQETLSKLQETQKLVENIGGQLEVKDETQELQELDPQPNLDSYYRPPKGGKII